METITLQFQTPQDLTNFRKSVNHKTNKIDILNLRLTCQYTPEDVALAINSFGAKVVEQTATS